MVVFPTKAKSFVMPVPVQSVPAEVTSGPCLIGATDRAESGRTRAPLSGGGPHAGHQASAWPGRATDPARKAAKAPEERAAESDTWPAVANKYLKSEGKNCARSPSARPTSSW